MNISQGDIFLADLNPTKGHEQSGYRPVLVLQNNFLNNNLNTVIIAPITSQIENAKGRITTFFLEEKISGLKKDSIVLLFQIRTLDKKRLKRRVASLDTSVFEQVKKQMGFVF